MVSWTSANRLADAERNYALAKRTVRNSQDPSVRRWQKAVSDLKEEFERRWPVAARSEQLPYLQELRTRLADVEKNRKEAETRTRRPLRTHP